MAAVHPLGMNKLAGHSTPDIPGTPSSSRPPMSKAQSHLDTMYVKRLTLTSKKNWWLVEMDEDEESRNAAVTALPSAEEPVAPHHHHHHHTPYQTHTDKTLLSPPPTAQVYNPPRHPNSIFSFPTPTAYAAPPNPTENLAPCAQGSTSELFKCVVKKPDVVQLEINGEMHGNAGDVTTQFLAELRVYTTLVRHRNIAAFLGCLENVGMVLEYIDGRSLYDVICERPELTREKKIDYHNQLLDGLTHLHSYGLSHGDLSLLNIQVTLKSDTIKLLDFGRSVSVHSQFTSPDEEPADPFAVLKEVKSSPEKISMRQIEQIHPGTRPFTAPEILRGECQDPLLADAYGFGVILVCLDRCMSVDMKPWDQRKDIIPKGFFDGCNVFGDRAREYLKKWDSRRRLQAEDAMVI